MKSASKGTPNTHNSSTASLFETLVVAVSQASSSSGPGTEGGVIDMSTVAPSIPESLVVSARIRRGRPKLSEQKDISKSEQALLDEGYRQIIDQIAHDASEDSGGRRRQFVCTVPGCGKVFFQRAHLNIHIRSHTGYKPYACPYPGCGKSFPQRGNMRTHERTHTGDRPFKCSVAACQRAFTQRGNLKTHLKKVHGIAGGDSGVSSPSGGIQKSTSSRNKQAFSPSAILSATNASFVNSIGSSGSG